MRSCYAYWRSVMVVEALIYGDRDDLRAPSTEPRILFYGEQTMGFGDGTEDRLRVERHQRAHVDNLGVDAMFRFQRLGRLQRARHHQRQRQNGGVLAGPHDL